MSEAAKIVMAAEERLGQTLSFEEVQSGLAEILTDEDYSCIGRVRRSILSSVLPFYLPFRPVAP